MTDLNKRIEREADTHTPAWVRERRENTGKFYKEEITTDLWQYFWNRLGDLEGKSILEYGCGDGERVPALLRIGASRVVGIDIAPKMVELAESRFTDVGKTDRTDFHVMDAHKLALSDGSFDQVVGISILHHLNLPVACSEIHRILKPGGEGLFIEPLGINPMLNLYRWLTPRFRTPDERPFQWRDLRLLNSRFETTVRTFVLLSLLSAWKPLLSLSPVFRMLDRYLLKLPFLKLMAWTAVIHVKKLDTEMERQ